MPRTAHGHQNDVEMGLRTDSGSQESFGISCHMNTSDRHQNASSSVHSAGSGLSSGLTSYHASTSRSSQTQEDPAAFKTQHKPPPLNPSAPGDWVVDNHRSNILTALQSVKNGEQSFRVCFAEMQRMHLRKLQIKLIKHAVDMKAETKESPNWEDDLKQYIDATKDYHYMTENTEQSGEIFIATGDRVIDRWILDKIIGHDVARLGDLTKTYSQAFDKQAYAIGESRAEIASKSGLIAFRKRFTMALSAALLLLGPMWLMVLHNTVYTGLITTTACVAFMGALLTYVLEKPMDVLSGTSAYAAVLVVFVGLTNSA